jgi:hypothetical protein
MFRSTPACEGDDSMYRTYVTIVSIHARVRAGDKSSSNHLRCLGQFRSTPACERATPLLYHEVKERKIGS